ARGARAQRDAGASWRGRRRGRGRSSLSSARVRDGSPRSAHRTSARVPGRPYLAVIPPSATTTDPVTNDDSSDARKSATFAISRGSPGRPIGWNESISAYTLSRPPRISAWAVVTGGVAHTWGAP